MTTLIKGAGPWATLAGEAPGPRNAQELLNPGLQQGYALLVDEGVIQAAGPPEELIPACPNADLIDLQDRLVIPGFVDPHTHPVFAGTREEEFAMRLQGQSYAEIARAGGGIRNSVRRLRGASLEELARGLETRADRFLLLGTTTIEAKSGYGLSTEAELRSLRAIRHVAARHPLEMVPTFLGAHEIPDEYQSRREEYVALLVEEMIPQVAAEGLAEACDVFCEEHVFSVEESRRILSAAQAAGLAIKLHADELAPTGGAELAAELHALSADHLVAASEEGIRRMGAAGVIPILLPGTSFFLNLGRDAPGARMLEAGLCPALATDFNPGSCPSRSMPLMMTLACLHYGMTPAQALGAATYNAAHALGRGGKVGALAQGFQADLAAFDLKSLEALPYFFGENHLATVIKRGRVVVEEGRLQRNPPANAHRENSG